MLSRRGLLKVAAGTAGIAASPSVLEREAEGRAKEKLPDKALGPYEASLLGTPLADPERPLEVLRTIHSFDPCLACAVHLVDTARRDIVSVRAL